jgi:CHAT domain-containing protein
MISLAHSFLAAGAGSVMASLWDVDDEATAELMELFYSALHRGMNAASALRQAQLRMAASAEWSAPRFWAGFYLVGNIGEELLNFAQ